MSLKEMARMNLNRSREEEATPTPDDRDPVSLSERIGIKYASEIPDTVSVRADHPEDMEKALGRPILAYKDQILAWEADPDHIKVFAWAVVNLFPGKFLPVNPSEIARVLELKPETVRESIFRLIKDGDVLRTVERGREMFKLNIQY